jgi:hypothetical protein
MSSKKNSVSLQRMAGFPIRKILLMVPLMQGFFKFSCQITGMRGIQVWVSVLAASGPNTLRDGIANCFGLPHRQKMGSACTNA